jgi:isoquinoline 1-oxidoreductase beta subunit
MKRREFLRVSGAAGASLTLAIWLDGCGGEPPPSADPGHFAPNAWLRIDRDGIVTVIVDRSEMGQGVSTALPMLVAEELDADWSRVRYEFAPANEAYYNPLLSAQLTGGSTAVAAAWEPLRRAGATARAMLLAAAAAEWGVPAGECRTESGEVVHDPSGRRAGYGSLATRAASVPVPESVPLKPRSAYRLIGTPVRRLDLAEKVTGRATFGLDAGPRDALVAVVARCPVFGGSLRSVDDARARAVPGVRQVVRIEGGVAVVADHFWAARQGREALALTWDEGPGTGVDDASVGQALATLLRQEGRVGRRLGDPVGTVPAVTVTAEYEVPYLAHATMEPMNCTAQVRGNQVDLWVPTQFQAAPWYFGGGGARGVAAKAASVPTERVRVHTTHLGGGFGRRSELDVVREAVEVSKAVGRAVRLVWTREDDVQHDHYRPRARHALTGGLSAEGTPTLWRHHVACQSIIRKFVPGVVPRWAAHLAGPLKGGVDSNAIEGAPEMPYAIPNLEVAYHELETSVPVGFWRSVGHSHTAFAVECFIDELAHAARRDPVEFRRSLLASAPRHRAVLDLAAERAGWGTALEAGRGRGVAVHESFGSFVAQVAEVSVGEQGGVRVHRVVCVVDCGIVVNPDTVAAQMESGIAFGLGAALSGKISIDRGRARESNFHDYPVLRMNEMPVVEVHIVPSEHPPGGVGEPGTPPIAPAVANAVFALTGQRVRSLPIVR